MHELIEHISKSDEHEDDDELKDHQENDDESENNKNLVYTPERALFYYIFDKE